MGFVEHKDNVYYFAANISAEDNATGIKAKEIALKILNEKGIY